MVEPVSLPTSLEFHLHQRAGVVSLPRLRDELEARLTIEERNLSAARERGEDVALREREWVRALRRYERLCDLLARQSAA